MLSPKFRPTLIIFIAAGSFATATIAPAVSQAEDNSYSHAAECEQLKQETESLEGAAYLAKLTGKRDLAAYYSAEASDREADAMSMGCKWTGGEAPDVEAHHGKAGALEPEIAPQPFDPLGHGHGIDGGVRARHDAVQDRHPCLDGLADHVEFRGAHVRGVHRKGVGTSTPQQP